MLKLDLARPPRWLQSLAEEAETKLGRENEARRRKLADELDALEKRHETESRMLQKEVEKLGAADAAAQLAASKARDALCEARGNLFGEMIGFDHRSGVIRKQMRELADPQIDAARADLIALLDRERGIPSVSETQDTGQQTRTGRAIRRALSNRASVVARLNAIRQAINDLEALKESRTPDVAKAIAAIRASIPERGGLVVVTEHVTASDMQV